MSHIDRESVEQPQIPSERVEAFLQEAAKDVSRIEGHHFWMDMYEHLEGRMVRGDENQILIAAINTMARAEQIRFCLRNGEAGINIRSKWLVEGYHANLFITYTKDATGERSSRSVIVEIDPDGQDDLSFHERMAHSVRVKIFSAAGRRVLRISSNQIIMDPYRVAFHVLKALGAYENKARGFDPSNPFLIG